MPKNPYNWTTTLEFEEIYKRKIAQIITLSENPIFIEEWKEARTSKYDDPINRQREMRRKQKRFCKRS